MPEPALHQRFPELVTALPHVQLGDRPTPVRELAGLGTRNPVWCKDESTFGSGGWGGNKVRKLEWILPDVRRRGAHTILTFGAIGTNWGLATARYAREQGVHTALALVDQPRDERVEAQLDRLRASGATLHFTHTRARTIAAAPWLLARHFGGWRPPYVLPAGGSSAIGALGYVEVALELAGQVAAGALPVPAHVVTAVGTGGTAAGLALGLRLVGLATRVVGVVVNDSLRLDATTVVALARKSERLLRRRGARLPAIDLAEGDVTVVRDWLGPGYGHATPEALAAQRLAAAEGLDLEPVYTAKALAAVLAMDADGRLGEGPVLFVNTHGPR